MILIENTDGGDPLAFEVRIREADGETRHHVTLRQADRASFGDRVAPQALVRAAFLFLLDREPKESILARFDLSVVPRYFPEFARELPRYLDRAVNPS